MLRLGFVVAACLIVVTQASANEPCTAMAYRDQNQVDTKIHIQDVKGVAIDEGSVPIPGVCVGVFAEPDHRLIAIARTDANGKFRLPSIGRGTYRLVAEYQGFGVANSTIIVGKKGENSVVVRMRPAGIDSTSYVEKAVPR
jgi:hypothetical protein